MSRPEGPGGGRARRGARPAAQRGRAPEGRWTLEPGPASPAAPEPLMGWTASGDVGLQVRLRFPDHASARAWAGGAAPGPSAAGAAAGARPRAYADNFARGRRLPWTH